jgi:succinate dehydrogenase / fumarate reductase flavoprotein subunit
VARCIIREVKAGRGIPHGGVFLDIAWIKEKISDARGHIKRKLPSMYHQFKELADIDITEEADGSRADDALHHGRHPRGRRLAGVDDPGHVRGRVSARRASTAQPPRRQFAVGPDRLRQARRRIRRAIRAQEPRREVDDGAVERAMKASLAPFDRGASGENPVQGPARPAGHHAGARRHRPHRERDAGGARAQGALNERGRRGRHRGHREFNAGWHTCIDLRNLLDVSEAIDALGDRAQGKPRRHFRDDFPDKKHEFARSTSRSAARPDGIDEGVARPLPAMPRNLKQVIEEQKQ